MRRSSTVLSSSRPCAATMPTTRPSSTATQKQEPGREQREKSLINLGLFCANRLLQSGNKDKHFQVFAFLLKDGEINNTYVYMENVKLLISWLT